MLHLGVLHATHSAGLDEAAEVLVGDALPEALVPLGPAGAAVVEVAEDGAVLQPPAGVGPAASPAVSAPSSCSVSPTAAATSAPRPPRPPEGPPGGLAGRLDLRLA